jgi:hypothetical protein
MNMNERIKELVVQAGFSETYGLQEKERLSKFAELIVQECTGVMFQMWFDNELEVSATADVRKKVRKHFGVEE